MYIISQTLKRRHLNWTRPQIKDKDKERKVTIFLLEVIALETKLSFNSHYYKQSRYLERNYRKTKRSQKGWYPSVFSFSFFLSVLHVGSRETREKQTLLTDKINTQPEDINKVQHKTQSHIHTK